MSETVEDILRERLAQMKAEAAPERERQRLEWEERDRAYAATQTPEAKAARAAAIEARAEEKFLAHAPAVARMDASAISHGDYSRIVAFVKQYAPRFLVTATAAEVQQGSAMDGKAIAWAIERAQWMVEKRKEEST